jgi:geranylgeranyl pyrophosphate synthase
MPNPVKADEGNTASTKSKYGLSAVSQAKKNPTHLMTPLDLPDIKEFSDKIEMLNQTITKYLESNKGQPVILYEAAHHLILQDGKRLRSLLTLLACEAVNGDVTRALKMALAAELVQTASLINDDMIDDDTYRRGVETVHRRYGSDIALLASNLLIAQAVRLTAEIGFPELLIQMAIGGVRMCEGETQDILMNMENQITFNEDAYFQMITNKTVAFMRQAALIGGIVGNASKSQIKALTSYGEALGYTFQLRDDMLDVDASPQQVKKTTHSDLRMKRGNLTVIHALKVSQENERSRCLTALEDGDFTPILGLIRSTNALDYTFNIAESFNKKAKRALQGQGFINKKLLEQLADYVLLRSF